jgi:hypothetical protein
MHKGYNHLWPTDILLGDINDDILNDVCQEIFSEIDLESPPSDFQQLDILDSDSPVFQKFKDQVVWPAFDKYLKDHQINLNDFPDRKIRSWIAGAYRGYMIPAHNHSGSSLSAVFYLLCGDQNKGGELVLVDSRSNANRGYKDQFKPWFENKTYLPKTGEYIIFPSHVYHHTLPFTGSMRLAMPVDLFL